MYRFSRGSNGDTRERFVRRTAKEARSRSKCLNVHSHDPFPATYPRFRWLSLSESSTNALAPWFRPVARRKLIRNVQDRWTLSRTGLSPLEILICPEGNLGESLLRVVISFRDRSMFCKGTKNERMRRQRKRRHRNFLTVLDKSACFPPSISYFHLYLCPIPSSFVYTPRFFLFSRDLLFRYCFSLLRCSPEATGSPLPLGIVSATPVKGFRYRLARKFNKP